MYLPTPGTPPIDSIDLGLKFPASLGDFVWSDTNGNGQQDLGEPGLAGVTVSLTDGLGNPVVDFDGNPVGPTTTDGAGAYAFTNLEPGDYIVVFGTVTGYDRSPTNVGPDATDSDADQTTGQSPVVNLESGENDPTIDAGFILNSPTIDIEKFTNGQDADNAPGVIILVPNVAPIVTWTYTVTNTGNQDLINVLVTDNLEGVVGTIPFLAVGASETLTLTGTAIRGAYRNVATVVGQPIDDNGTPTGNTVTDNDPSNYTGVFINIEKIADRDEICPGEEVNFTLTLRILGGIEGIQLRAINVQDSNLPDDLMPGDANFVASSDLNNNGFVDFIDNNNDGISDEEFVWQYALSYLVTTTNEASDMAEVWYVDPITGDEFFVGNAMNMDAVTVTVNELLCASLGDFVWEDTNGNGIQDAGEPGVGGVTVNLKDENGNVIATTTTAGNGSYSFTGLTPGTYSVQFVLPGGYTYTTLGAAGSTEQNDSDADPAMNGMTAPVTLVSGENNPDLDAGLTRGASLGDFVWEDTNGNGIQDAGEPGVGGVTVNLKDANGNVIATTATAANGSYSFTGLTPGTYSVQFVLPGGYTYTTLGAAGSTEQNDSDADPAMNGMTAPVTLISGQNNPDLDAGIQRVPDINLEKDFLSAVLQPDGSYELTYEIRVINSGGIGQYTLTDTPGFDNDVTINSGGFSAGLAFGGGAFAGTFTPATGTQTLNTNQTIPANGTDVYQITYNVTLDLTPGSTDGGDNVYTACGTGGPRGNGMPGQGLYNLAQLDTNGDGQPDSSDDACGDLPNITMEKTALGVTANPDGTFGVSYLITVTNNGGAEGTYSLTDQAAFDDDITIIAGGFTIDRDGVVLAGNFIGDPSPLTLATNETIAAGSTHTYQIDYLASIDLSPNSTDGGDNEYTACTDPDGGNGSNPGEGLYNMASLDLNDDGIPEITDDVCLDIPSADLSLIKTVSNALVEVGEIVTFTITVRNDGPFAATGVGVEDVVPNGYSNITNISSGGAAVANVINWTGLNIPVNGQVTLTFRATVGAPGDGVDYVNLAEISTSNLYDPDSTPGNGPDTNPGNGIGSEDPDGTQDPNDEDDGDDASVNPPCMIMADFEAMPCNNNGTPANPNDDFFTVVATITGNNTGGGFTATDSRGNTFTGTYGTEITFGNYSIFGNTGEEVIITVVDNNNDNCATVIVVTTPATCSRDCALTITTPGTPRCVGGETNTPDDDRFFFSINVVGANTGNQGWRAVDQFGRVYTGNYGVNTEIGAYGFIPYAGTNIVLTIRDVQNPTCGQGTITLAVPTESCSRDCSINLTIQNIICDPMGTIWDPSDDVFYAWVLVSGENESFDGWVSDDEGVSEGDMGGSGYGLYEFGPYPISGGNHLLEIRDRLYEGCEASIMLNAPNTCSDGCLLTVTQQPAVCDDQGTSDPSDDTYTVVVRVMPQGDVSGGWRVVLGNGQFLPGGNYGEQVVLGPYLISQGPRTIKIADNQTLSCQTTFGLNIPDGPCSEACSMQAGTTNQGPCNNNGTNNTTADDYYILSYGAPNVTMPAGTQYQLLLDGQVVATNNYGNGGTIQVPANGATHTLTWRDATDNTCAATRTLPAVQPCSVPDCSMQAGTFTQGPCDDNGAPNNSNDDFYVLTYSAPVVSNPVSTQYQLLVNGTVRATRPYGQGGTIQVPANGATLTLTWRDATDPTCAASRTLPAVQPCSVPDCSMQAGTYTQGPCNDNGTPNNSNDDFYVLTYSAPVVSNPVGTQYQLLVNGTVRATRPYGQGGTVQLPANGATLTLTWRDATDPTCAASLTLPAVQPCSVPDCSMQAGTYTQGPCNDNGTPNNSNDDFYVLTYSAPVVSNPVGTQYQLLVNGVVRATRPYGQGGTIQVPANGATLTLTWRDATDPTCAASRTLPGVASCSNPCEIVFVQGPTFSYNNNGTPDDYLDDTYDMTIRVTNTGVNSGFWTITVNGQVLTYPYDQTVIVPGISANQDFSANVCDAQIPGCCRLIRHQGQSTVGNFTWIDANCNGIQDSNEPGLGGVTVTLTGTDMDGNAVTRTTTSNANGFYLFTNLPAGMAYKVTFSLPSGYTYTTPNQGSEALDSDALPNMNGMTNTFVLLSGMANLDIDAGYCPIPDPCNIQLPTSITQGPCQSANDVSTYLLTFTAPVIANGCGQYQVLLDGQLVFTGSNGVGGAITVPADNASHTVTFRDLCSPACAVSRTLQPVAPCNPVCSLEPGTTVQGPCNDNGTPENPNDDFYVLTFGAPSVQNGCEEFQVLLDGMMVFQGPYTGGGSTVNVPADGSLHRITFRDACSSNCARSVDLPGVGPCSEDLPCAIGCVSQPSICNDNGTPNDPSDDTYTAVIITDGLNTGSCFTYTIGGVTLTGTYGVPFTVGPFPISGGNVLFPVVDCDNPDCTHLMLVIAPETCSTGNLTVECPISNHFCPILNEDIMLYRTDPFECTATVAVTPPIVTGACPAGEVTFRVQLLSMFGSVIATIQPGQPLVFPNVSVGDYILRYLVTDACGVTGTRDCIIRVADIDEPVVICHGTLNVQLGGWGLARVYPQSINNGSYDNCAIASIELRRRYDRDPATCEDLATPTYSSWGPYVEFSCCDASTFVTVEMRVTDVHGNFNTCWLEVLVEDKTLPYCTGLADETAACEDLPADFDPTNTMQLAVLFGTPEVIDNCSAAAIELAPEVTSVDDVITIVRNFQAIDAAGNVSMTTFQQVITLTGCPDNLGGGDTTGGGGTTGGGTTTTDPSTIDPSVINTGVGLGPIMEIVLGQNYPNPTTGVTVIPFYLPTDGRAVLEIFDARGSRVFNLRGDFVEGRNEVTVDAARYEAGLYFYKVNFGGQQVSRKMIVTNK